MDYTGNRTRPQRGNYHRMSSGCRCSDPCISPRTPMDSMDSCCPLGIACVTMQRFESLYSPEKALMTGTIFSQLDYPFTAACCKGGRL